MVNCSTPKLFMEAKTIPYIIPYINKTTQDAKKTKHVTQFIRFTHCHWHEYNQLSWKLPCTETREVRPPTLHFLLMSLFQLSYSCLRKPKPTSMEFHPPSQPMDKHTPKQMLNLKSLQFLTPKFKRNPNWLPIRTCVGRLFPTLAT